MNQLIVIAFDHLDDARTAMKRLRDLEGEARIRFEDTAIVERDADGKAHVRNEVTGTTETAAVVRPSEPLWAQVSAGTSSMR